MILTINSQDTRSLKAIEIAADAGQWLKVWRRDGVKMYGIPSQSRPGLYYLTTLTSCSCPDFAKRQLACKHTKAVKLHVLLGQTSYTRRAS